MVAVRSLLGNLIVMLEEDLLLLKCFGVSLDNFIGSSEERSQTRDVRRDSHDLRP